MHLRPLLAALLTVGALCAIAALLALVDGTAHGQGVPPQDQEVRRNSVTVSGISANSATVSWMAHPDASGYHLWWYRTHVNDPDPTGMTLTHSTTSHTITGLHPTSQYIVVVRPQIVGREDLSDSYYVKSWRTLADPGLPTLSISDPGQVSDVAGNVMRFPLTLSKPAGAQGVTIRFEIVDTGRSATAGADYTAPTSHSLRIASGQRTASVDLTLLADTLDEGEEEILIVLVSADGANLDKDAQSALGTIKDIASTAVALAVTPGGIVEHSSSSVTVTGTLNGASASFDVSVTITVGKTGDSAASGTDYTAVAPFTLTIPAGSRSATAAFNLAPINDDVVEPDETLTVHGTASGLTVAEATIVIVNDDIATTAVELSLDPDSVDEDAGATTITVTGTFDGTQTLTANQVVTVSVGKQGDSAASGTDYTAVAPFTLTIPAGSKSATADFSLTPTDDSVVDPGKTLTVHGSTSGLTVSEATIEIANDDIAPTAVNLSVEPTSVGENAGTTAITVTGALNGTIALGADVAVSVVVGRPAESATTGTDYNAVAPFTLTIPAGSRSATAAFNLTPIDDNVDEPHETITVHGSTSGLLVTSATIALNDEDITPSAVVLSVDPGGVAEDASATSVTVTGELNGTITSSTDRTVTITVGRAGDTAVSGTDYAAVPSFSLTIPGGSTSGMASFNLDPTDNNVVEFGKSLTLSGSTPGLRVESARVWILEDEAHADFDADNDGLIEVSNLAQLDAIRHDLDGDGVPDLYTHGDYTPAERETAYKAAFSNAGGIMGCPYSGCIGYELKADLDFDTDGDGTADSGDAYWNDGKGWKPILGKQFGRYDYFQDGSYGLLASNRQLMYEAVFEGNGHTIDNLYIHDATSTGGARFTGLFGYLGPSGVIRNIGLLASNSDSKVYTYSISGSLVGVVEGASGRKGGGYGSGARVEASYSHVPVETTHLIAGGLAGVVWRGGRVVESYATGAVSGQGKQIGGLIGRLFGGNVAASFATGTVSSAANSVGGLVGRQVYGWTRASYASGAVTSAHDDSEAGGLLGYIFTDVFDSGIEASYSTGGVTGKGTTVNGFMGVCHTHSWGLSEQDRAAIESELAASSYFDSTTTGRTDSTCNTGKSTSELQKPTGYTGIYADWNMDIDGDGTADDPWDFGTSSEYPILDYCAAKPGIDLPAGKTEYCPLKGIAQQGRPAGG